MAAHSHTEQLTAPDAALPPLPSRQERWARAVAAAVFFAAALLTWRGAQSMSGAMPMPGGWNMPMMWMVMSGETHWHAAWMFLFSWQAMMIAMMLPSSWPMLELYRRVAASTSQRHPSFATALAGAAYFTVWLVFGAVAFGLGLLVSEVAMKSDRFSRIVPAAAGVTLVFAGIYQLSPLKQACLRHCRSPLLFLSHAWRPGLRGAVRVGVVHGAFCAACCWALMLIQMVLGVMNLAVMIAVAAVIAFEKLWKRGPLLARLAGAVAIVAGLFLLAAALLRPPEP